MDTLRTTFFDKYRICNEASVWRVSEVIGDAKIRQNFADGSKCPRTHSLQMEDTVGNCQSDVVKVDCA